MENIFMSIKVVDYKLKFVLKIIAFLFIIFLVVLIFWQNSFSSSNITLNEEGLIEAKYYSTLQDKTVQCQLCFRKCILMEGERGFCLTRENIEGKLYSLVYGNPVAVHIDPIEKEPMYHFYPGTDSLCLGTAGCNFRCLNCINWQFAIQSPEEVETISLSPAEVVQMAIQHEIPTICFTYNDPIVLYEYVYDTAKLAKEKGLKVSFHSNGSINHDPLVALLKYVDAVAIDIKAFNPEIYRQLTGGELSPVLETLKIIKEEKVWLEVIYLIIPTINDDLEDIKEMCLWIKEELGEDTPLHFSRFFPACKLTRLPPTSLKSLENACKIAQEIGLHYVYIDNVPGNQNGNTFCPNCGKLLIHRVQFLIFENNIEHGKCKFCGYDIPGYWKE
ncbi:MAG TPA: AmmeMemoRadiSam system radical SAM enzyme [Candidatus Atribacteria bacterium]|nr:AmmeMemoRadiSam system radical SAM enzyme [Candidatus Atribacteria bacterium]